MYELAAKVRCQILVGVVATAERNCDRVRVLGRHHEGKYLCDFKL